MQPGTNSIENCERVMSTFQCFTCFMKLDIIVILKPLNLAICLLLIRDYFVFISPIKTLRTYWKHLMVGCA